MQDKHSMMRLPVKKSLLKERNAEKQNLMILVLATKRLSDQFLNPKEPPKKKVEEIHAVAQLSECIYLAILKRIDFVKHLKIKIIHINNIIFIYLNLNF